MMEVYYPTSTSNFFNYISKFWKFSQFFPPRTKFFVEKHSLPSFFKKFQVFKSSEFAGHKITVKSDWFEIHPCTKNTPTSPYRKFALFRTVLKEMFDLLISMHQKVNRFTVFSFFYRTLSKVQEQNFEKKKSGGIFYARPMTISPSGNDGHGSHIAFWDGDD